MNPRYPVYVISKGRWETRKTVKALDEISVPYHIVIEPQEFDQYAAVIDPSKLLVLPFSNLGQGSIPARNWVWEYSRRTDGAERHWILDDNIEGFYRLNRNLKTPIGSGTCFRAAEDFTDRYTNVLESGFNYFMFASRKTKMAPYSYNTRIYSCILLKNDLPAEVLRDCAPWRGRYNEDTDLSLRILKAKGKYCTILFNAFLAGKCQTMTMKGGNTDELYKDDGRVAMAMALWREHDDVTLADEKHATRWGRRQHVVDYGPFRKQNKLRLRSGLVIPPGVDNYGMELWIDPNRPDDPVLDEHLEF